MYTLQVLGLLITYFLLVVQFANPSAGPARTEDKSMFDSWNETVV